MKDWKDSLVFRDSALNLWHCITYLSPVSTMGYGPDGSLSVGFRIELSGLFDRRWPGGSLAPCPMSTNWEPSFTPSPKEVRKCVIDEKRADIGEYLNPAFVMLGMIEIRRGNCEDREERAHCRIQNTDGLQSFSLLFSSGYCCQLVCTESCAG